MADSNIKIQVPFGTECISKKRFYWNKTVREVRLPSTVRIIEPEAFCHCESLEKINIPEGVTRIQKETFYCCKSLVSISLPSTVRHIDQHAFQGCSSLEEVTMPDNVSLDCQAFEDCPALRRVVMREMKPEAPRSQRRVAVLIAEPKSKLNTRYFGVMVRCQKRDDITQYASGLIRELLYMTFKDTAMYLDWEEDEPNRAPLSQVLEYDRQRLALVEVPADSEVATSMVDSKEYITDEDFYRTALETMSPDWKPLA